MASGDGSHHHLPQMCNMLGLGDMNADQLASKLEETLPVIRSVSEQFKDPVRPPVGWGGSSGGHGDARSGTGMPSRGVGTLGEGWGQQKEDRDVAKLACAHSCGESSAAGLGRDPSRVSVPDSWVCRGDAESGVTLRPVLPSVVLWCHAECGVGAGFGRSRQRSSVCASPSSSHSTRPSG